MVPLMMAALLSVGCSDDPVEPAHVHSVSTMSVAPATMTLNIGEEANLTASATCSCGDPVPTTFSWTTSAADVATVSSSGVVKAVSIGNATVSVTAENHSATATIVVAAVGTVIGPSGGTVVSTDANVELVIPEGALATPTDVVVQAVDAALFAGDPNYIPGTGYLLKPDGLQLQTRAQLRIRYNPNLLPPGVVPEQLRLQERDRVQNQWRETQQHQLLTQKVQGEIERFGIFAIVVKPLTGTLVGPAGGTVVSSDGNAVLTIPTGALTGLVEITIEKVDDPFAALAANALPAATEVVIPGTAYDMKPAGQAFQVQAQLRIGYDPANVPSGFDPQLLRIRQRDREQNRWRDPSQCTTGNNQVSTMIGGLGLFAIVAATEPVVPPPNVVPALVTVSPALSSVDEGDVIQLTATVFDADGNIIAVPVTWTTSDASVATVDQTGLVTGVAQGSVTISAQAGGQQGGGSVNVTKKVASVTVKPSTASIVIGSTVQLTAELKDADGNLVTRTVTWQSSDQNVATVSGGFVTGVAAGSAVITARVQNVSGSATVTVIGSSSINSVVIAEIGNEPLEVGLTLQLTATVYANGVPVNLPVTWSSSDVNIATVENPTGLVTAVASGTVTITATAGTASDAVEIKVVGGGETETLGNNLSVPVVFADGVGITGSPVSEDPGVRPLLTEGITIDVLPFWYSGNVADYNTYFLQQGTNTWRPEILDGTGQAAYSASIYWGDNLTVKDWSAARPIRVEQALSAVGLTMKGYNMTYLYGDGPTEMYGANGTTGDFTPNIYTKDPQLIVEKLQSETGGVVAQVVNVVAGSEVNVAGKLIYGYNLRLSDWVPPTGVTRDGWYKITFRLATSGNLNITAVGNAEGLRTPTFSSRESSLVIYVTP